ncbi:MAG: hypothetical protein H6716_20140 [Polyangiaceae bacterium]|nr:hypothetical protein [Polyangiaceae bacterium]
MSALWLMACSGSHAPAHTPCEPRASDSPNAEVAQVGKRGRAHSTPEPTFGAGLTLLGPAIFGTYTGSWFAQDWLVAEVGLRPDVGFEGFTAVKFRPGSRSAERMWFGASIAAGCRERERDTETDESGPWLCEGAAALRVGADVVRWRVWQFTPEIDARLPTDSLSDPKPQPWAGFTASYLF